MFSPYPAFNPEGERILVRALAASLTREPADRRRWPWSRRPAQKPAEAASPTDARTPVRGEQLAPSRS